MYKNVLKPLIDFFAALILLVLLSPVLLLSIVFIYMKMGQPIFFRQDRPGLDEKIFSIYKFRTMSNEKDSEGNLLPDEKRLHGFGKILRSLSIDELPQLLNVLKGEMSFIGPRPLLVEYLPLYNEQQKKRHNVKPGITGWAQVNGRNAISWQEKFDLDVWYVENLSFWLDLKIMLLSFYKVFKREGVSSQDHVSMEKFSGSNNE
jgi:lipopolysaccharide/colanic/teichoic acid biosynthesis glycosyltransferase